VVPDPTVLNHTYKDAGKYTISFQTGSQTKNKTITVEENTQAANITVLTPVGGEVFATKLTTSWKDTNTYAVAPKYDVWLRGVEACVGMCTKQALGKRMPVVMATLGTSYEWTIPASINDGIYRIEVCGQNSFICDASDASFTIKRQTTTETPIQIRVFKASPESIKSGNTSTLSWDVTGATKCELFTGETGEAITMASSKVVTPEKTTEYRIQCTHTSTTGTTTTAKKTVKVTVEKKDEGGGGGGNDGGNKIQFSFTNMPFSFPGFNAISCEVRTDKFIYKPGEEITISWKSNEAKSATFDAAGIALGLPSGPQDPKGSATITLEKLKRPTPVTLTVTNDKKQTSASCSATIIMLSETGTLFGL
jgi:hypothetical protein